MKRRTFVLLLVALILSAVWTTESAGQGFWNPFILIQTREGYSCVPRRIKDGIFFSIDLISPDITTVRGVKEITAKNINAATDQTTYQFNLTPSRHNLVCEWLNRPNEFTGQEGTYKVTVLREIEGELIEIPYYTNPLPPVTPLPAPQNLKVNFESGNTTPTLSFDSVDDPEVYYQIRIYDADYSRRIYIATLDYPLATFPDGREGSTAEDLVPEEKYIFRAVIVKDLPGVPELRCNYLQANTLIEFKIPKID